jgi:uncharacterized integral membrane protein
MSHLRAMLIILFVLLLVILAVQNYAVLSTPVTFKADLVFVRYQTSEMPLALISVAAFVVGMLATGFYGMTERFRLKREIKILTREAAQKDQEIDSLRNLPVTAEGVGAARGGEAA